MGNQVFEIRMGFFEEEMGQYTEDEFEAFVVKLSSYLPEKFIDYSCWAKATGAMGKVNGREMRCAVDSGGIAITYKQEFSDRVEALLWASKVQEKAGTFLQTYKLKKSGGGISIEALEGGK